MLLLDKIYNVILSHRKSRIPKEIILSSFPVSVLLDYYDLKGTNPSCVYFGDSVAERISKNDKDVRTIHQMIISKYGNKQIFGCISNSAYHIGVFYMLTRVIQILEKKPLVVIFPINMRSFSPQWDLYPPFQCTEHINILKLFIRNQGRKINYPLYGIDNKGDLDKFYKTKVKYPLIDFTKVSEFTNVAWNKKDYENNISFRLRVLFIFHYLYTLDIKHRKLKLLQHLIDLLRELNIKTISYITPINYKAGLNYVGREFNIVFCKNVELVCNVMKNVNNAILFDDYSTIFDQKYFFNKNETTEHLNEKGRLELASLIRNNINKLL